MYQVEYNGFRLSQSQTAAGVTGRKTNKDGHKVKMLHREERGRAPRNIRPEQAQHRREPRNGEAHARSDR
jgi:hypothetical protein